MSFRAILIVSIAFTSAALMGAQELDRAAYLRRGDDVEATRKEYAARLQRYDARLRAVLQRDAPELLGKLSALSPPALRGYQLVPRLIEGRAEIPRQRFEPVSYSWPRTQGLIDNELAKLARDEALLDASVTTQETADRARIHGTLVDNHRWLVVNRDIVDAHVGHNRLWQAQIAGDRERFDRQGTLLDALSERAGILEMMTKGAVTGTPAKTFAARAEELARLVARSAPPPAGPGYLRRIDRGRGTCTLQLPLYSDIADAAFLSRAERVVEDAWSLVVGGISYRVDVEVRRVAPGRMYAPDAPPAPGALIDVAAHAARFPSDGAVLTTGAERTHAMVGRYVALGPTEITGHTLAHEFGHLLGFADHYVRAARDLGEAGFEIIEAVPDHGDIMSAPASGQVLPSHIDQLFPPGCAR